MFSEKFNGYVCIGDTLQQIIGDKLYIAKIVMDDCWDSPDERQDGFWPSLDPNDYGFIGAGKTPQDLKAAMDRAEGILRAWRNDEWMYVGVAVTRYDATGGKEAEESLWGLEANYPGSDNSYLTDTANELLELLTKQK